MQPGGPQPAPWLPNVTCLCYSSRKQCDSWLARCRACRLHRAAPPASCAVPACHPPAADELCVSRGKGEGPRRSAPPPRSQPPCRPPGWPATPSCLRRGAAGRGAAQGIGAGQQQLQVWQAAGAAALRWQRFTTTTPGKKGCSASLSRRTIAPMRSCSRRTEQHRCQNAHHRIAAPHSMQRCSASSANTWQQPRPPHSGHPAAPAHLVDALRLAPVLGLQRLHNSIHRRVGD